MKALPWLVTTAIVVGCGGGSGNSTSSSPAGTQTTGQQTTSSSPAVGGTAASPKSLALDAANGIGADPFFNYYAYTAAAGERLVLRVNLARPLSDTESTRCASNDGSGTTPSSYATQVHIYDARGARVGGICGEDLAFAFPAAGSYVLGFEFPSNDGGAVHAASLKGTSPVQFSVTGDGTPSRPKPLNTVSGNDITENTFRNYFWVSLQQGQTLVLGAQLRTPLTTTQKMRCASSAEATNNAQLRIFDATLVPVTVTCGESARFVAPSAGTYIIQTDFGANPGVLSAVRI